MRVFLGLTEIAGYYRGLKEGFTELGVPCTFIDLHPHPFEYGGADANPFAEFYLKHRAHRWTRVRRMAEHARKALFAWALARHDLFIFSYGTSLLPNYRDLPLLRRAGKQVIFQFHGSDSRPSYLDGALMNANPAPTVAEAIARTKQQKARLRTIERWATATVNIPPQAHLQEQPFVIWMKIGLPSRPVRWPARETLVFRPADPARPLRVLHSPSHPAAKGSLEIAAAVEKLKRAGVPLDLIELRGRPNAEVLAELERADLVIDQLYADYAMPGFATEAAWYGRPVIIGGYAQEMWEGILAEEARPPTHYCRPEALEDAIRTLAFDVEARRRLGLRARDFVERQWHPRLVAQRYLDVAAGRTPPEWWYDPRKIDYWQGVGFSEERVRQSIRSFIQEGGIEALCVGDKPALERLLRAEAGI